MLDNAYSDQRGQLEEAFNAFNLLSDQLQSSYQVLERRVTALTAELEETRRAKRDAERRKQMAEAASAVARPGAADHVAGLLLEAADHPLGRK